MRLTSALLGLALLASRSAVLHAMEGNDSVAHLTVSGELSYSDVSGNKSLSLLRTGLGLKRLAPGSELGFLASMRYGKSNGEVAAENYETELNARFQPNAWVSPFFYGRALRDRIKNQEIRIAAAAGAEVNLSGAPQRVSIGVAVLEDYERRIIPAGSLDPASISSTRFNLRFVANPTLRKGVTAEHRTQFEPVAGNFGNYLFTSQTSLRVLLTGGLAFQTSYEYNYDSTPAPGVTSRSDRALTTGLIVEFK